MKHIKKKIDKLTDESTSIHASPDAIEKLKAQGLPFRVIHSQTIEELFSERKKIAARVHPLLPSLPHNLSPAIRSLYQEIRECIFFGLNGAAITLSGNLIEFTLKHFTFLREAGGYENYNPDKWDSFENIELGEAIGRAKKSGLLSSKMGKRLQSFREDIRNPYSHYNIKTITRNVIAGRVKALNIETGDIEEKNMAAKDHAWIQAEVKPWVDGKNVLAVFYFADEVVKYLSNKYEELIKQ